MSAPVPVSSVIYAKEKVIAYRKSIVLANQLPLEGVLFFVLLIVIMPKRIKAPESKRTIVKLDASMVFSPSAKRHNTEFAANAIRAKIVNTRVLTIFVFNVEFKNLVNYL